MLIDSHAHLDFKNLSINLKKIVFNANEKNISPPLGWSLEGAAPCAWLTNELSKSGVIGDSRGASIELGDQLRKALVEHWHELLLNLIHSEWPPVKPK